MRHSAKVFLFLLQGFIPSASLHYLPFLVIWRSSVISSDQTKRSVSDNNLPQSKGIKWLRADKRSSRRRLRLLDARGSFQPAFCPAPLHWRIYRKKPDFSLGGERKETERWTVNGGRGEHGIKAPRACTTLVTSHGHSVGLLSF